MNEGLRAFFRHVQRCRSCYGDRSDIDVHVPDRLPEQVRVLDPTNRSAGEHTVGRELTGGRRSKCPVVQGKKSRVVDHDGAP